MLRFQASKVLTRSNFCGLGELIFAPLPTGLALPKRLREGDAGRLCVKGIYVEGNTNPETYWTEHELPEKFLTFTKADTHS